MFQEKECVLKMASHFNTRKVGWSHPGSYMDLAN
jgi:hypothetical protein